MPQGLSWFDRVFQAPAPTTGQLPTTPLEQTNPGLAKLRDLIGGFIGTRDALQPTSSGATLTGAAMASLIPLAGVLKMGQGEQAAVKGIKAYHGSPHDFEKFSLDKVGTGQGAQTYGHGLYFAENPTVAQEYKNELGKKVPAFDDVPVKNFAEGMAHEYLKAGKDSALARLDRDIQRGLFTGAKETKKAEDVRAAIVANLDKTPGMKVQGKTYEVAIKADPDEFLHWDKPLSEQPAIVDKLRRVDAADDTHVFTLEGAIPIEDVTGEQAYRLLKEQFGNLKGSNRPDQAASRAFRRVGIKGIKYLDQGSRASSGGKITAITQTPEGYKAHIKVTDRQGPHGVPVDQFMISKPYKTEAEARAWAQDKINAGTHNYVVFDDQLIEIRNKYGVTVPQALVIQQWLASQEQAKAKQQGDIRLPKE